ncbi:MAG: nucleotidyltransferase domain-containing protein [Bacteroidales bacterium]|nr:nucleotidyltransferase domain-containing protein [Bacteroidales bacterium]
MDQTTALIISRDYLLRLKSDLDFSEAWLFGSYARGSSHENSDIDIAIVMNDNLPISFETEVKLMTIRKGEETLIEPHVFSKQDFNRSEPLVDEIMKYGVPIYLK